MKIKVIDFEFTVCKVHDYSELNLSDEYCFIGKTPEENSLVCPTKSVPQNVINNEDGWRGFKIEGILDFSLIGILSRISGLLAENDISIFALSTFNTDYVLVKEENFEKAIGILKESGYEIS